MVQIPVDCDQDIDLAVAELKGAISVNGGCGSGESSIELTLLGDGNCQDDGYIARYQLNIMASDPCSGEDANLQLTIDFVDQTPPVISGPEAIVLNCGNDIPLPTAEDACDAVGDITFIDNAASCSSTP